MDNQAWVSHLIEKACLLEPSHVPRRQDIRAPDRQTHPIRKGAHLQILQGRSEPQEAAAEWL